MVAKSHCSPGVFSPGEIGTTRDPGPEYDVDLVSSAGPSYSGNVDFRVVAPPPWCAVVTHGIGAGIADLGS